MFEYIAIVQDTTSFLRGCTREDIFYLVDMALQQDNWMDKPVGRYKFTVTDFNHCVGHKYRYNGKTTSTQNLKHFKVVYRILSPQSKTF